MLSRESHGRMRASMRCTSSAAMTRSRSGFFALGTGTVMACESISVRST